MEQEKQKTRTRSIRTERGIFQVTSTNRPYRSANRSVVVPTMCYKAGKRLIYLLKHPFPSSWRKPSSDEILKNDLLHVNDCITC